jgi:tetrapyrrole methylase family protein/MazG family protein
MKLTPGITLLGLGPGDPLQLTRRAWELLQYIPEIYLRTGQHPVVAGLLASLQVHSFDYLYEENERFEDVYSKIVERVLQLGQRPEGVVYAVPGHPFIAEATSPEIARRAKQEGIPVTIVDGLSFIEPVFSALGIDLLPQTALVDALDIAAAHVPSFPPDAPALIAQVHSRQVASNVKLTLMEVYPDEHPVRLVHAAGTDQERVEDLPLYEIDRSEHTGLLTSLYVTPLAVGTSFEAFQEIIAHLRAPNGCPWDREQTHETLRENLIEEAYEVLDAIDRSDPDGMREEYGDLLLQIVLNAQIAAEYGEFRMKDVLQGIYTKIVSRHPHVFGEVDLKDAEAVLQNWERLKAAERKAKGDDQKGLLDAVPKAMPALLQAQTYQKRAARVGFDWPEIQGVLDKLNEEWNEFNEAAAERKAEELGDVLFAAVNLARWYDINAEDALREANARFKKRFAVIEQAARDLGKNLDEMSLDEMEEHWQRAKKLDRRPPTVDS